MQSITRVLNSHLSDAYKADCLPLKEAAEVWVRMSEKSNGKSQPKILSTHPSNVSRIQDLKTYLPTAKMYAAKYNDDANSKLKN